MKLEQLQQREDFYKIFSETVGGYLNIKEEWDGEISWSSTPKQGALNFLVNKKTNLIILIKLLSPLLKKGK